MPFSSPLMPSAFRDAGLARMLRQPGFSWLVILMLYGGLLLPSLARQGISWDEQTDILIARSYLASPNCWLVGSREDPSQTRLPMFTVALVYRLLNRSDLITARAVSVGMGALTLLAVFLYGQKRFSAGTGLLACGILATCPFFLAFARVAFTETDIYLACTLAWLLVFLDRLQDHRTLGQAARVGVALGLALSAKATILAILPAVWLGVWQAKEPRLAKGAGWQPVLEPAGLVAWTVGWLAWCGYVSGAVRTQTIAKSELWLYYLPALLGWLVVLAWAAWRRDRPASRWLLIPYVTLLAGLTFWVVPPEHLTNPAILDGLSGRLDHEMAFRLGFMLEAAGLHLLCILFKPGLGVGAGFLLALAATLLQWNRRGEVRLLVLVVVGYFAGLLLLPLAQSFYTVPLLPLLAVLLADQFLRLLARQPKIARVLAALAILSVVVDVGLCYPDYHLNGYQWLGVSRIAGRPSLGYRSIVQTPSDGVEQAFQWLNAQAQPGEQVLAYVLPWHIVRAAAPEPQYRIVNGFQQEMASPDYVVTEVNALIPQSWWTDRQPQEVFWSPYPADWLAENYTRVFTVQRAFGIEMAAVWQKKHYFTDG